MDETDARAIFDQWLRDSEIQLNSLVPLYEWTVTKSYGWVFFWQTRRYIETQDRKFRAVGNAPVLVKKEDGSLIVIGTAFSVEHYLNEYENGRLF